MRLRLYIVSICLCLTTVHAVAFGFGTQAPSYTMRSTSASHMTSMCRTTNELATVGNTSGHFSTYVHGVGEEFSSPAKLLARPRRVDGDDESHNSEEPGPDGNPNPIGDIPWLLMLMIVAAYLVVRRRKSAGRDALS